MIFMKAEITVNSGCLQPMIALLKTKVVPIMESSGAWTLEGCFVQRTGRLGTIVDLWRLESYAAFDKGFAVFRGHADYPDIREKLDRYVETETLIFMEAAFGRLA